MNYRHAFHAGNHADVLKHVVLLALCDALTEKPSACFALDTHAGAGLYRLDDERAQRSNEWEQGFGRLARNAHPAIDRYLAAVDACRTAHGALTYPGSPWLLAHALRDIDRIACCELHPDDAVTLASTFRADRRVAVHRRDGYAATRALLPPVAAGQPLGRGLVLIDPPYETRMEELDAALQALRDGLQRWPQGVYLLWFPIKRLSALHALRRRAAALPARSVLWMQLLVHAADSPLRLNGSGLLLFNAPWALQGQWPGLLQALASSLRQDPGARSGCEWLKPPA